MKKLILPFILLLCGFTPSESLKKDSKKCDINIEILKDRFMKATAETTDKKTNRINVEFAEDFVTVQMPKDDGTTLLIKINNSNCEGYCRRDKKIRQLNKGDEKLLRNILKKEQDNILAQVTQCAK